MGEAEAEVEVAPVPRLTEVLLVILVGGYWAAAVEAVGLIYFVNYFWANHY